MKTKIYRGKLKRKFGRSADMPDNVSGFLKSGKTDPNGSYTGLPTDDGYDVPVQDADDL